MNPRLPALLAAALLLGVGATVRAEAPVVKVTTVLHADGTRTETQTNREEKTSEERTLDAKGKLLKRVAYKLDDAGLPFEGEVYNAKGQIQYRFSYARDPFGRLAEEKDFTPSGQLFQRYVFRYNSEGKVIGVDAFDANGNPVGPAPKPTKRRGRR